MIGFVMECTSKSIAILRKGQPAAMLLFAAYHRLALLDHVVIASSDMQQADLDSFRAAPVGADSVALNALMEDVQDVPLPR